MKNFTLGLLMLTAVPCIALSAVSTDIPGGGMDLLEGAKDASLDQKHCLDVAEANRPLRKKHSVLRKEYKTLIDLIRKHYKDKHCTSDGHALLLPIENKALEERIKGLQEIIKNQGIQTGG